jgi:hypothetical protein
MLYAAERPVRKKFVHVLIPKNPAHCVFYSVAVCMHYYNVKEVLHIDKLKRESLTLRSRLHDYVAANLQLDLVREIFSQSYNQGDFKFPNRNPVYYKDVYDFWLDAIEDPLREANTSVTFHFLSLMLNVVLHTLRKREDGQYQMWVYDRASVGRDKKVGAPDIYLALTGQHFDALLPGRKGDIYSCIRMIAP